jgi:hypothetical protein
MTLPVLPATTAGSQTPATGGSTGGNIAGIAYGSQAPTPVPTGVTIPSTIQNQPTPIGSDPIATQTALINNTNATTNPPPTDLSGTGGGKAPPGYEYNAQGKLVPLAPDTSSLNTTSNASDVSNGTSYSDLLTAIANNLSTFQDTAQKNAAETQAEQNYLQAIQTAHNFQLSLTGGELNQYGVGRPLALSTGRAAQLGFNNQLQSQALENAANIAGQALGLQQTSRQIRTQAATTALQTELGVAGLAKPEPLSPGSSLVSPFGQSVFQGSGFTAPSLADVASLANQFLSTGQAADYGTAYQMAVKALQTGFGTKGQSSPLTIEQANPSTSMQKNDFLGYDLSTYATDPAYASKLTPIVQQISSDISSYGPQGMQSYIQSQAPNSPITGQMVYNASSSAGIDPRLMLGMLQLESNFGTQGAGAKTMNPGNVGNTDNGSTVTMPSWQAGLNAMAQQLANRRIQSQSQNQQPQAPAQLQPALATLSDGTPFINQDKIPSQFQALAQLYSSQTGIPILTGDEVTKARSIDITTQNLQQIANTIPQILGSGLGGRIQGVIGNNLQALFQTNPTIASFQTYRDTAINAIQALAGGSGSGFRLNQAEIDTATSNLPTITDNLETAQNKLAVVQSFVNKWKNELLQNQSSPTSPDQLGGNSSQPSQIQYNGQIYNVASDGTLTLAQ